jgi:hypothetical protein
MILGVGLFREQRGDYLASEGDLFASENVGDHHETLLAKVGPHRVRDPRHTKQCIKPALTPATDYPSRRSPPYV